MSEPVPATMPSISPVDTADRILAVDLIRGVSLLGILLMNIVGFGLPLAYIDPTVYGGATGADFNAWFINQLLFEGKMRAISSMLFGAGVIILTSRWEARGGGISVADIYFRRTLWLALFGLVHAYFIWDGDILFYYGVTGLAMFPLRNVSARALLVGGVFLLALVAPKYRWDGWDLKQMRDKAEAANRAAAAGQKLTEEQTAAQKAWEEKLKESKPPQSEINKVIKDHKAGYVPLFLRRIKEVPGWHAMFTIASASSTQRA